MPLDNYLIEYEDLMASSINNLLETIRKVPGKKIDELRVKDLTYHNSKEIWPGEGVYLFRDKDEVIYVGKATSMSFTERIPKHFDFRQFAWFNRLLELICKRILELEWNDENAKKSSKYAYENLNLVLINFTHRERIGRIERLLRSCTESLNKFKYLKEDDLDKKLDEY